MRDESDCARRLAAVARRGPLGRRLYCGLFLVLKRGLESRVGLWCSDAYKSMFQAKDRAMTTVLEISNPSNRLARISHHPY